MGKRKAALRELFTSQRGKCYLCSGDMTLELGKPNTAEIEHIVPSYILKREDIKNNRIATFNLAAARTDCNRYKAGAPLYKVITDLQRLKLCNLQDIEPI
jgi:hypothetical protein